jgi:L-rhamnose mutarotase
MGREREIIKRIGFLLKVKEDRVDEYKKHHQNVWPEMRKALSQNGWGNYSLFMRQDGLMFGYFETPEDFQTALGNMDNEEINARWQEFMAPFFQAVDDTTGDNEVHADKIMVELEEVFHLD